MMFRNFGCNSQRGMSSRTRILTSIVSALLILASAVHHRHTGTGIDYALIAGLGAGIVAGTIILLVRKRMGAGCVSHPVQRYGIRQK